MRLLLAALTVGAAGIGYVYLHQPSLPAAENHAASDRPLFDWQSADETLKAVTTDVISSVGEPPLIVRDTINNTRTEITSVLDEFVRVNGESAGTTATGDIVTQAGVPGTEVRDEELIPFATSDGPPASDVSDIAPADATTAANLTPTQLEPTEPLAASEALPTEVPAKEVRGPVVSKPAINEASQIKQTPGPKGEPAALPRNPELAAKQPSKTELLPGGKMPEKSVVVMDPSWKIIGKSTNGVPLHSRRFGRQGTRTLVIAGIDGQDLVATRWNDELAETLSRRTEILQANEVLMFRAGNPDGLIKRSSANVNGVLINRNFPSRRYQFLTDKTAGPGPASEAETKVILESLYTFRPRRVIHLTSTTGRSIAYYNRASKDLVLELQKQFDVNEQPLDVELLAGSLEDFADGTMDAAVISLKLNTSSDWQQAWKKHLPLVLTAINGQNPDKVLSVSEETAKAPLEQVGSPVRTPGANEPIVKRRGVYEELPPPQR